MKLVSSILQTVKDVSGLSDESTKARRWQYSKRLFFNKEEQTEANAEGSTTKNGAKRRRRKGNKASSTGSLLAITRGIADYRESSSVDEVVRPVRDMAKRLVSSKARKEHGSESKPKMKKARTSNDTTGTDLLFDDKDSSSLTVGIAWKEVSVFSASLLESYLAACIRPPVSEPTNKVAAGNKACMFCSKLSTFHYPIVRRIS